MATAMPPATKASRPCTTTLQLAATAKLESMVEAMGLQVLPLLDCLHQCHPRPPFDGILGNDNFETSSDPDFLPSEVL